MSCESVQEQLSAYIDSEVEESLRHSIKEHLRTCQDCQLVLSELQELSSVFETTFSNILAPKTIEQNVLEAVGASHESKQVRRLSAVYLMCWALSIAVVAAITISPVGAIMRAIVHLFVSAMTGAIYLSPLMSSVWFIVVTITCILLAGLSILGIKRVLRFSRAEGVI